MAKERKRPEPFSQPHRRPMPEKPKSNTPPIVRSQPKEFDRRRLLLRIWSIVAIVLAFSIGLSIFFRVDEVTVTGCDKYSAWTVCDASEIEKGDSLLFFGKATAGGRILSALPYIRSVRFSIRLPGSVNIIVEEAPVAYAIQAADGSWWMMTSDGKVAEQTDAQTAQQTTVIRGVNLREPQVGQQAQAFESQEQTAATGADRLDMALQLARLLEENELLGSMSYLDVGNLQKLQMWYASQYRIDLGDREALETKLATVKAAIPKIGDYQSGLMELVKDGESWKVVFINQKT